MSEKKPGIPDDPINEEASDWEEAGLPAQEDSTEDTPLPSDREGPAVMGGVTSIDTDTEESLDEALSREERDLPEAGGSTARSREDTVSRPEEQTEGTRLVEPREGVRAADEDTLTGDEAAHDRAPYSAEEQAVRVESEPERP